MSAVSSSFNFTFPLQSLFIPISEPSELLSDLDTTHTDLIIPSAAGVIPAASWCYGSSSAEWSDSPYRSYSASPRHDNFLRSVQANTKIHFS